MKTSTHEDFARDEAPAIGSDRSFGIVMSVVFAVIAAINAWYDGRLWPWALGVSILFLAIALVYAVALGPLNRGWLWFGAQLHKVVSPVVMGLLFYGTVLPTALVIRITGKDLLRLRRQPESDSYWIVRRPPGPSPETMKDQF